MLPFHSLAPTILLPVLAFAYMLYVGAYTLNKSNKEDKTDILKVQKYTEPWGATLSGNINYYYNDSVNDKIDSSPGKIDKLLFIKQYNYRVIKIPDKHIRSRSILYSLFARPPPATK